MILLSTGSLHHFGTQRVFELAADNIDPVSLSAPNLTPEAILREEVMNRRQRQRKRSETYGHVERNW